MPKTLPLHFKPQKQKTRNTMEWSTSRSGQFWVTDFTPSTHFFTCTHTSPCLWWDILPAAQWTIVSIKLFRLPFKRLCKSKHFPTKHLHSSFAEDFVQVKSSSMVFDVQVHALIKRFQSSVARGWSSTRKLVTLSIGCHGNQLSASNPTPYFFFSSRAHDIAVRRV